MTTTIDPAKTYRTRDGREVRIYAVDGAGKWPIHGALKDADGWKEETWTVTGRNYDSTPRDDDLIEVKPKHVRWVNVYDHGGYAILYDAPEPANIAASKDRFACVRIEFEEGEGIK